MTRNPSTQLSYHATQLEPAVSSEFTLHPSKRPKQKLLGNVTCSDSSISKLTCHFLVLWHPIFWVPYNKHDDRLPISSMTQLWSETSGGSAASTGRPSESSIRVIRGRSPVDEFNHRIKINSKSRSNMIELIEPTKTGDGSDGPNQIGTVHDQTYQVVWVQLVGPFLRKKTDMLPIMG